VFFMLPFSVHSAVFAIDRQFCRRDMDAQVKKDVWSVIEDLSKSPGGKDLSKMKSQYAMFVDAVDPKQVTQLFIIFLGTHTHTIVIDNIECTVSF
jgi:hypothetical protein